MMGHAILPAWALIAYLISGVLFILALRGLSSPTTSRAGNRYGMAGMAIAVLTTMLTQAPIPPGGACSWTRPACACAAWHSIRSRRAIPPDARVVSAVTADPRRSTMPSG